MPSFDIAAAANAASSFAGGLAEGRAQKESMELRRQSIMAEQTYRQGVLSQRQAELDREAQAREGENKGLQEYLRMSGSSYEPGDMQPQGPWTDSGMPSLARENASRQADVYRNSEAARFDSYLKGQRIQASKYIQSLPPEQQLGAMRQLLPGLAKDEQDEKQAFHSHFVANAIKDAINTGVLFDETDQFGENEAIKGEAEDAISGLMAGTIDPEAAWQTLNKMRDKAVDQKRRQFDLQFGMEWGQRQIAEAGMGGSDVSKLHDVYASWIMSPKRDVKDFQRNMLEARYNLKPRMVKIGGSEYRDLWSQKGPAAVFDPSWRMIAEAEADSEVAKQLSDDPKVKQMLANGEFDGEEGMSKYLALRERLRKTQIRKFGAQFGASDQDMEMAGFGDPVDREAMRKQAEDVVRKKLKEAGIDPDQLEGEAPQIKSRFDRGSLQQLPDARVPGGEAPMGTDPTDDVYDEAAIERSLKGDG